MEAMTNEDRVKAVFLRDISKHEVKIFNDNGIYRYIEVAKPGTNSLKFSICTYPGYLVYSGDMGCYVFSRLHDMFEFFRSERSRAVDSGLPYINAHYWGEKCRAVDIHHGIDEFCPREFESTINKITGNFADEEEMTADDRQELIAEVESDVIGSADDGEQIARQCAMNFEWNGHRIFTDLFEYSFRDYSYHYIWACLAIAWTVREYDDMKNPKTQPHEKIFVTIPIERG